MAASPAVVSVSLRIDFTAVGRATIAIGVARAAADAASPARASGRAVVARAYCAADSTIARVSRERFFTTISGAAIAISVQVRAGAHRAGTGRASGCCMGIRTDRQAIATVV